MRIAVLKRDKCKKERCGYICQRVCPGVRMGEETIVVEEETGYPVINEDLCTGCGICVKKCPYNAISIVNLPELKDNPVHQYGKNGFRVFGLPVPREGVVSLIGQNGIGKTTIMKILAGKLMPNLGKESTSWEEVIERFKGHEIQSYLEALKAGKISVSFKPQEVDRIPSVFKGTVRELVKQTADIEWEEIEELAKELGVWKLFDRKLGELSGGELQRVAILVAISRKANLYFLDEPSSFLDIRERMRFARLISKLSEKERFMLVEHDLVVLDYLSNWVHVLYGKPGTYGIVSTLKSARNGINEYLDGYLRAENMRIREKAIKFEVKPPASEWKGKTLVEYPGFTKTYEHFRLEAEGGELRIGEVVGIVGPNAIGKTTFLTILAGELEHDSGKLDMTLKISYKPQYISLDFDGTVREYIATQDIDQEIFSAYIRKELQDLMEKQVQDLSGGELQRLSVGVALARKADICLLDEPSAFLDIEQRLRFSDIIRTVSEKTRKTTVVIDHDITFIDYVSNRLIVFSGEPGQIGFASAPMDMREGMNKFLKEMDITFRRDPENGRPRVNKPGSQKDREQKEKGEYYYTLS